MFLCKEPIFVHDYCLNVNENVFILRQARRETTRLDLINIYIPIAAILGLVAFKTDYAHPTIVATIVIQMSRCEMKWRRRWTFHLCHVYYLTPLPPNYLLTFVRLP